MHHRQFVLSTDKIRRSATTADIPYLSQMLHLLDEMKECKIWNRIRCLPTMIDALGN
uniref:Uncharacterized protein n=1 Tax=Loa loa TaxID=7209 RepID=A0A1I7VIU2_LOALO